MTIAGYDEWKLSSGQETEPTRLGECRSCGIGIFEGYDVYQSENGDMVCSITCIPADCDVERYIKIT